MGNYESIDHIMEPNNMGKNKSRKIAHLIGRADKLAKKHKYQACEYFEQAAELGSAEAMCRLGSLLRKTNKNSAIKWYTKATFLGSAEGMRSLGYIFWKDKQIEFAISLLTKSSDMGNMIAMWNLGCILHENGMKNDACMWIVKSASLGYKPSVDDIKIHTEYYIEFRDHLLYLQTDNKTIIAAKTKILNILFSHYIDERELFKIFCLVCRVQEMHEKMKRIPVTHLQRYAVREELKKMLALHVTYIYIPEELRMILVKFII